MFISAKTIDDLLRFTLSFLIEKGEPIKATRGNANEVVGVLLELQNPRSRISRTETRGKPFSALGELLWYLSGKNRLDFIEYYVPMYKKESDDGLTIHGGYGPRLFKFDGKINQINNIIDLLRRKPTSRRAVIQIFKANDLQKPYKEIPCTCTLQFFVRDNKLDMLAHMRSNDAYLGLPHDIFAFTMIQELIARSLNLEIGTYRHSVGSLHVYERDFTKVGEFLSEGVQSSKKPMPPMPLGDQWDCVENLLKLEKKIRSGQDTKNSLTSLDPYWNDLFLLLKLHYYFKKKQLSKKDSENLELIKNQLSTPIYNMYIEQRLAKKLEKSGRKL